ncbi:MAG TPA: Hsp70 family protein, partial [Spirochaetota bacterium]|nr:Hsp70 family protein [Spirochaetota bacterium]
MAFSTIKQHDCGYPIFGEAAYCPFCRDRLGEIDVRFQRGETLYSDENRAFVNRAGECTVKSVVLEVRPAGGASSRIQIAGIRIYSDTDDGMCFVQDINQYAEDLSQTVCFDVEKYPCLEFGIDTRDLVVNSGHQVWVNSIELVNSANDVIGVKRVRLETLPVCRASAHLVEYDCNQGKDSIDFDLVLSGIRLSETVSDNHDNAGGLIRSKKIVTTTSGARLEVTLDRQMAMQMLADNGNQPCIVSIDPEIRLISGTLLDSDPLQIRLRMPPVITISDWDGNPTPTIEIVPENERIVYVTISNEGRETASIRDLVVDSDRTVEGLECLVSGSSSFDLAPRKSEDDGYKSDRYQIALALRCGSKVPLDQYGFRLCYALRSNNDLEGARRASIPFTVIVKAIASIPTMAIDFGTSNSCVWYEYKAKTLPAPIKKIVDPAAINFFRNLRTLKIDKDVMTELDADSHGDGYLRACSIIKTGMLYSMDPSGTTVSTVMDEPDPRSITLFKRDLASGKTYTISNAAGRQASLTPEQVTTDFLRLLLQSAIKEVGMPERLVVTHPVVFDSHQLKALKDAVVSVYDGDIRWVDEARAAMFRYALYRKDLLARKIEKGRIRKDQYGETAVVVLFDLGGGTLDVTSARLDMTLSRDGTGGGAEIGKGYFFRGQIQYIG